MFVDQYNEDGSFDEHKVMLGFNSQEDAEAAYFANYDKDWAKKHKTVVTPVNLEDFEKWVDTQPPQDEGICGVQKYKTVEGTERTTEKYSRQCSLFHYPGAVHHQEREGIGHVSGDAGC